jgi:tryptophan-rich sensory protein
MKRWQLILFFLVINFGGLAIGSWLMDNGPMTEWYINLNQAPWTPPGWVFGVAWTTIMICFSIYLGALFSKENNKKLITFYIVQVILNVSWNYLFFNQHLVVLALINIVLLTSIIFYFYFKLSNNVNKLKYLLLPYMIWLCIATSLNLYILIHN